MSFSSCSNSVRSFGLGLSTKLIAQNSIVFPAWLAGLLFSDFLDVFFWLLSPTGGWLERQEEDAKLLFLFFCDWIFCHWRALVRHCHQSQLTTAETRAGPRASLPSIQLPAHSGHSS